eukprot:10685441-Alexandrium_andersonii.AAC.1
MPWQRDLHDRRSIHRQLNFNALQGHPTTHQQHSPTRNNITHIGGCVLVGRTHNQDADCLGCSALSSKVCWSCPKPRGWVSAFR